MHIHHLVGILPQDRGGCAARQGCAWPLRARECCPAAALSSQRFFASSSCVPGTSGSDDERQVADRRAANLVAMFAAGPQAAPALELCHEDVGRAEADLPTSLCRGIIRCE